MSSQDPGAPASFPLFNLLSAIFVTRAASSFNNSTPTAKPTQTSQGPTGVITGTVGGNDVDGDPLTYTVTQQPTHGSVTVDQNGTYTYTPTLGYAISGGQDAFTVKVAEVNASSHVHGLGGLFGGLLGGLGVPGASDGSSVTSTVPVTVAAINTKPVAGIPASTTDPVTGIVTGSTNFTQPAGLPMTYAVTTPPVHGVATVNPGGTFTYTPTVVAQHAAASDTATAADTTDRFTVTADTGYGTAPETVTVTVTPKNSAPVAGTPTVGTPDPTTGVVTGTLGFTDADADKLAYKVTTVPTLGTVAVATDGTFAYTPTPTSGSSDTTGAGAGKAKLDTFTVTADDAHGGTATQTLTVTVQPATSVDTTAPVAGNPAFTVVSHDTTTGVVTGTLNVTDPLNQTLTYTLTTPTPSGTVTVDSDTGAWAYTPNSKAGQLAAITPGEDSATFVITATNGANATADVTVTAPITAATSFAVKSIDSPGGNQGLAVAPDGRFYYTTYSADGVGGQVVVLNPDGTYATTVDIGSAIGHPNFTAYDVAVCPDGRVFVSSEVGNSADEISSETGHGAVVAIDPANGYQVSLFAETSDPASALAVDDAGHVYVADWNNDDITVLNADGTPNKVIHSDLLAAGDDTGIAGMALGADGKLYLTKPALGVVKVVNADGTTADSYVLGGQPWAVAVSPTGGLYVTDAGSGTILDLGADGTVLRPITIGYGAALTDVTVAADGTVYAPLNGEIAAITAVSPSTAPDPTQLGQAIPGLPAGSGVSGGLVVAGGVTYQTVVGTDASTGAPTTTVAVIAADGTTTLAHADGTPTGPVVVGPNGVAYQTISSRDTTTGAAQTGVVIISPGGASTFTGAFSGSAAGPVAVGAYGSAYQVLSRQNADSTHTTTILTITSTGVVTHEVAGAPATSSPGSANAVVGPDGTVYVTTVDYDAATSSVTTRVGALGIDGLTTYTIAGYANASVAVAADGTVYQSIAVDPGPSGYTFATAVAVLTPAGFVTLPDTLPGLPLGSPQIAANGAVYQPLLIVDTDTGTTTTTVAKVTDTGVAAVFQGLPGTPYGADGDVLPVVLGSDGTVYQTVSSDPDPDTGAVTTSVAMMSPGGTVTTVQVSGQAVGPIVAGPDAAAYQTTYDPDTDTTRVAVFTATRMTVQEFDGSPRDPAAGVLTNHGVVIGGDGNAYQTVTVTDSVTGQYSTTVAVISRSDVSTASYDGAPSGPAVVGADGTVYQSVTQFDIATQTTSTRVLAVDASGLTPVGDPISGRAVGPAVIGGDGLIHQTTYTDAAVGGYDTTVHVVDPTISIGHPLARVAFFAVQSASAANPLTPSGTPIPVGSTPQGIAISGPTGRYLYVTNPYDGTVSVIDTKNSNTVTTVHVGNSPAGVAAYGSLAYVANQFSNTVSVIDTAKNNAVTTIHVGDGPVELAVSPDGSRVYVANSFVGTTSVIDTADNTVIGNPIPVGNTPHDVAVSADGRYVYVANSSSDSVSVIDTAYGNKVTTVRVGSDPVALTVSGRRVYVANGGDNTVSVIDTEHNNKVTSIPVGGYPLDVAASPSGHAVYVTNYNDSTVSVIDTASDTVIGNPIPVDNHPIRAVVSPDSRYLYVAEHRHPDYAGSVQVFSTGDSGTATKTPPKPLGPHLDEQAYGDTGYLLQRVLKQKDNGIGVDITTDSDGKKRVVAYIGGTGSSTFSQLRNGVAFVDSPVLYDTGVKKIQNESNKIRSWNNLFPEVMLVGYSQGGMDVQNIAHDNIGIPFVGLNITTVVTFASPINQKDSYETVHLQAAEDKIPTLAQDDTRHIYTDGTGLRPPSGSVDLFNITKAGANADTIGQWANNPVHNKDRRNPDDQKLAPAYLKVANDFDKSTDHKYDAVKASIAKFVGNGTHSVTVVGEPGLYKN